MQPNHDHPETEKVTGLALEVRAFLESRWTSWRADRLIPSPRIVSHSMCRMSSAFLCDVLTEHLGGDWKVVGGADASTAELGDCSMADPLGGMLDTDNRWNDHYWVVSRTAGILVDVTADQFGHEPVILSGADDARYKANYLARAVSRHLRDVARTRGNWSEAWIEASAASLPAP